MTKTVATLYFNGQFWVMLVERETGVGGGYEIARHVFGCEPAWPDLRDFYLNGYDRLVFRRSDAPVKLPSMKKRGKIVGDIQTAHDRYKELQKDYLRQRKAELRREKRHSEAEKYKLKRLKRKERKRGR